MRAIELGPPDAVGVNCAVEAERMLQAVELLRERCELPVWAKPQAKLSDKCATGPFSRDAGDVRASRRWRWSTPAPPPSAAAAARARRASPRSARRSTTSRRRWRRDRSGSRPARSRPSSALTSMDYDRGLATRFGDPGDQLTGKHLSCTHQQMQPGQLVCAHRTLPCGTRAPGREPAHRPVRRLRGARPRPVRRHPADRRMGREAPLATSRATGAASSTCRRPWPTRSTSTAARTSASTISALRAICAPPETPHASGRGSLLSPPRAPGSRARLRRRRRRRRSAGRRSPAASTR